MAISQLHVVSYISIAVAVGTSIVGTALSAYARRETLLHYALGVVVVVISTIVYLGYSYWLRHSMKYRDRNTSRALRQLEFILDAALWCWIIWSLALGVTVFWESPK
jgi:hypothetical protein